MPEDQTDTAVDDLEVEVADAEDDADDKGSDALGDAGKQALDRMKEQRNAARNEAREYKSLGLSPAEIKQILDARKTDDGADKPDADEIKRQARMEALTAANERILRSEVKAAAAGKFSDPADAFKFLDLTKFEVNDDGNVDEDEIAEAIDDLLSKKPYLAAQSSRFKGSGDGGARKESRPAQLTDADVKRLYAERKYAEIEQARVEGRLDNLLGKS